MALDGMWPTFPSDAAVGRMRSASSRTYKRSGERKADLTPEGLDHTAQVFLTNEAVEAPERVAARHDRPVRIEPLIGDLMHRQKCGRMPSHCFNAHRAVLLRKLLATNAPLCAGARSASGELTNVVAPPRAATRPREGWRGRTSTNQIFVATTTLQTVDVSRYGLHSGRGGRPSQHSGSTRCGDEFVCSTQRLNLLASVHREQCALSEHRARIHPRRRRVPRHGATCQPRRPGRPRPT